MTTIDRRTFLAAAIGVAAAPGSLLRTPQKRVDSPAMQTLLRTVMALVLPVPLLAVGLTTARPEDAGLSSERLARIRSLVQRHVDSKDISGAVTLVARRGKVVHVEAQGLADIDARRPMQTDSLFRMASMTKPLTAVAILMLME